MSSSIQVTVNNRLDEIENIVNNGLHPVYEGKGEDFLWDFYPGFSWHRDQLELELIAFYRSPRFEPLRERFETLYGANIAEGLDMSKAIGPQLKL